MTTYLVIGTCLILLVIVIFIASKPISMGIEARRNIKKENTEEQNDEVIYYEDVEKNQKISISEEILKLDKLKKEGILTEEEYIKAKQKIIN
tara:strand:+ start:954 stop:1229 length:276 start_codon:yes stop_codon:yes gene_type:complete